MKRVAFILMFAFLGILVATPQGSAQLAKYFDRSIEERFTVVTGTSIPLGPFMQKTTLDPNAGYANMSFAAGAEYTMLPLNGGVGLTAALLGSSYGVSMLPNGATATKYYLLSLMAGPRYEVALSTVTPISLYGNGQIGFVFSQSPDVTVGTLTTSGGNDFSFGVSVGGGAVFDKVVDVGVRYFYTEAKYGNNRLSADPTTRIEGLQATIGFLVF